VSVATLPIIDAAPSVPSLAIDCALTAEWLEAFLRDELIERRGVKSAVVGLSGGVDSAVTAFLCARALGPEHLWTIRMPYRTSSAGSLSDAQLVIDALGCRARTIDISGAVDGYLQHEPEADPRRRGNIMARTRMIVLFDQSSKLDALPIGTGNKTERLLGYFTWHADDSPPVNPLGDLFKTQVWALARYLGVPPSIVDKAPSADLEADQVPAFVETCVTTAGIGAHHVFLETVADVFGVAFEHHENSEADVVADGAAIALKG